MTTLKSLTLLLSILASTAATAHTPPPPPSPSPSPAVTITGHYDNAVGTSDAA